MRINTNICNKETTNAYAEMVLKTLKESLSLCLGPFGSTAILQGRQLGDDIMTKDGYTILKRIKFNDPIANTFLEMFRDASFELVEEVGDGSTTTIIAAYYIYEALKKVMENQNARPKLILDKSTEVVEDIIEELQHIKKNIPFDDLTAVEKIANTSLNNNKEVSKLIRNIYEEIGTEGFIKVKMGNTEKTYYKKTEGFQLDNGYYDKIFINSDNSECNLKDTAILIFDAVVMKDEDIDTFFNLLGDINNNLINESNDCKYKSVLVIAPDYSQKFKNKLAMLNNKYVAGNVPFNYCIIKHSLHTEMNKEILYDLSVMTNTDIIKNSLDYKIENEEGAIFKFTGYTGNVIINKKTTTFLNTLGDDKKLEEIKSDIKAELQEMKDGHVVDYKRTYELNKRLALINKHLVTLFVGGSSEQERVANKHLIDDAVAACKSALQNGYVIGGNLSTSIAVTNILKEKSTEKDSLYINILKAIGNAFINVYREVLSKSTMTDEKIEDVIEESLSESKIYDLTTNSFTKDEVINSVKTEIEILKNVISIISMILTSNQFIEVNTNTPIKEFDRDIYEV